MPAVSRVGDSHTNHPPCSPGEAASGSSNVFVNSISTHRKTDPNTPHGFVLCVPHSNNLSSSSETVFVNSLGISRIGDSYSCGVKLNAGSPNVFSG